MRAGPRCQPKMCTRFAIGLIQQLPHLSNLLLWLHLKEVLRPEVGHQRELLLIQLTALVNRIISNQLPDYQTGSAWCQHHGPKQEERWYPAHRSRGNYPAHRK